ncbi:MAG TPA: response regulator [Planctomycetaceae bacterium]|nr:response regulator [Planctomycetaceae bacterium]
MTLILVVDDSAVDRRAAGGLLERNDGWGVIYAADGQEALLQMERHQPDLVVADLVMPGISGLELLRIAKGQFPLIPVVMVTGKGSEETAVEALRQGAASYLTKRRLTQDLAETVTLVLNAAARDRSDARLMDFMTQLECRFVLESNLSLMPPLVNFLQQAGTRMQLFDGAERLHVGVALEEGLVNAYYHGNLEIDSQLRVDDYRAYYELARLRAQQPPYRDRRIYVTARVTRSEATYVLRDEGPGFDPASYVPPTAPDNIERSFGRGLLLMRTFMDEVRFNPAGNEVTLVKRKVVVDAPPAPHFPAEVASCPAVESSPSSARTTR